MGVPLSRELFIELTVGALVVVGLCATLAPVVGLFSLRRSLSSTGAELDERMGVKRATSIAAGTQSLLLFFSALVFLGPNWDSVRSAPVGNWLFGVVSLALICLGLFDYWGHMFEVYAGRQSDTIRSVR